MPCESVNKVVRFRYADTDSLSIEQCRIIIKLTNYIKKEIFYKKLFNNEEIKLEQYKKQDNNDGLLAQIRFLANGEVVTWLAVPLENPPFGCIQEFIRLYLDILVHGHPACKIKPNPKNHGKSLLETANEIAESEGIRNKAGCKKKNLALTSIKGINPGNDTEISSVKLVDGESVKKAWRDWQDLSKQRWSDLMKLVEEYSKESSVVTSDHNLSDNVDQRKYELNETWNNTIWSPNEEMKTTHDEESILSWTSEPSSEPIIAFVTGAHKWSLNHTHVGIGCFLEPDHELNLSQTLRKPVMQAVPLGHPYAKLKALSITLKRIGEWQGFQNEKIVIFTDWHRALIDLSVDSCEVKFLKAEIEELKQRINRIISSNRTGGEAVNLTILFLTEEFKNLQTAFELASHALGAATRLPAHIGKCETIDLQPSLLDEFKDNFQYKNAMSKELTRKRWREHKLNLSGLNVQVLWKVKMKTDTTSTEEKHYIEIGPFILITLDFPNVIISEESSEDSYRAHVDTIRPYNLEDYLPLHMAELDWKMIQMQELRWRQDEAKNDSRTPITEQIKSSLRDFMAGQKTMREIMEDCGMS